MWTSASNREPLAVRFYRSLLFVYPAEFRREYATEMKLAFEDRWREEGGLHARFWLQTVWDIACSAAREHLDQLVGDVRHTLRILRKEPGFAVVAVAVLALGIASTAIAFTVLNATLIRPLPYPAADRLVVIDPSAGARKSLLAWAEFDQLSRDPATLTEIGGCASATVTLTGEPGPEELAGAQVTQNMLPLLGVNPILGRLFRQQEHTMGNDRVVLLSHAVWRTRYGGDPAIVGKHIRTTSHPVTVIGVMPPQFGFPGDAQFWVPAVPEKWSAVKPTTIFIQAFGRMHAGATVAAVRSAVAAIMKRLDQDRDSTSWGQNTDVRQLREHLTTSFRLAVLASMGAVTLVLLISCANIANLLLARASARRREFSLRTALGADRSRIVRQVLVESTILAALGGSTGLLLVLAVKPAMLALVAARVPSWMSFDWDWRIVAFVVCVSLLTSVLVGVVPALRVSGMNPMEVLKQGGRGGSATTGAKRTLNLLMASQVAMSVLLLSSAGLLIRSFLNLVQLDPGFDHRNVLTFRASFPATIAPSNINAVRERALAELATLPGVRSVAMTSYVPLSSSNKTRALTVEGRPVLKLKDAAKINLVWASPGFFSALGIRTVSGRDFTWSDGKSQIAVVDATLANQYWPGQSAIGRRIRFGPPENHEPWHTVVGVVGEVKNRSLNRPQPGTVYVPIAHVPWHSAFFVLKAESDPSSLASVVKRQLNFVAGETAVDQVQTMETVKDGSVWQPRFFTILFAAFAAVALIVTAVGLYGVMSYSVTQRTHDLGVRIALGASAAGVVGTIVGKSMLLTGTGMAVGIAGAIATGKLIEAQLFGVPSTDFTTLAIVCAVVTAAAALASFVPAWRATQVDPIVALRHE